MKKETRPPTAIYAIALLLAPITLIWIFTAQFPIPPEASGADIEESFNLAYANWSCKGCNLVLVSVNALRADRLGVYGYHRNLTPNIDRLAEKGIIFENAFAQSGWTLPSYASTMTSLYPHSHGVEARETRLPNQSTTLAEIMQAYGYRTAAFVSENIDVGGLNGLDQGFETYARIPDHQYDKPVSHPDPRVEAAKQWLAEGEKYKQPVFLFFDSENLHCPYGKTYPSNPYWNGTTARLSKQQLNKYCAEQYAREKQDSRDVEIIKASYDWRVAHEDFAVGGLIDALEELGALNRTIIVLFSPHGEEFYEHNWIGHQILYDTILHVPLIIRLPNFEGQARPKKIIQLVDLMPTALDFLEMPIPHQAQGKSAAPIVRNGSWIGNEYTFAEQDPLSFPNTLPKPAFVWSARSLDWKYIWRDGKSELYDLKADPGEFSDISVKNAAHKAELEKIHEEYLKTTATKMPSENSNLSQDAIEMLKQYGYP